MHWARPFFISVPHSEAASADGGGTTEPAGFTQARARMVAEHLGARDIHDRRVLEAMARVPRHEFVPASERLHAYDDRPLQIGFGQTISQPYVVAYVMQLLRITPGMRMLDVGIGSGYQAAVAQALGAQVFGVEIVPELAVRASENPLLGGVTIANRDGRGGWPEHAPYDAIIVAAAAEEVPHALFEQLALGGRLVMPVGAAHLQHLKLWIRNQSGFDEQTCLPVSFVPLTGGCCDGR